MFQSKSGQKFGSAYVAKRHDDEADKKAQSVLGGDSAAHEAAETPEFEKGEQEGAKEAPEQVVAEHGPATNVTVHHDHKNNKHHVVSRHASGHMHTSDHASAQEAHDTASTLGGAQPAEPSPEVGGETAPAQSLSRLA
jgi:hypothetical protein